MGRSHAPAFHQRLLDRLNRELGDELNAIMSALEACDEGDAMLDVLHLGVGMRVRNIARCELPGMSDRDLDQQWPAMVRAAAEYRQRRARLHGRERGGGRRCSGR